MIMSNNTKGHQNQVVSDESKPSFLPVIIVSLLLFCFETHSCFTEAAEYLVNDHGNDEKRTVGEALSAANESPSFDVSRV